ncbi:hypothetical protein Tco_0462944 [Tanacetum coccineum]
MDDPNITMKEYTSIEEEKARRRAIVFNDTLTSEAALSCEPTVSSLNNDEIDFRISFDEFDDEDCTVIFDKKSFSYKIISVNNLKTDSENDNDKINMHLLPSPEPTVSCFDDLDFFKDFENEFPAIVYNNAQTSKSDLLTEPILNPQHIDEFNLKDETSLSECDEEEQNVLNFNDLFPFNVIYPNDSKSDKDNDDDKVDIEHSSGDLSVKPLPDVINTDVGAYAHGSNKLLETTLYYTLIRDSMPRLCHRLITYNIAGRSQVPEKVTVIDLFYLRGMDVGLVNIPYLLARYLRMFASGRKRNAMIYRRQFVAHLTEHFGLLIEERLQGLTMIAPQPPLAAGPQGYGTKDNRWMRIVSWDAETLGKQR